MKWMNAISENKLRALLREKSHESRRAAPVAKSVPYRGEGDYVSGEEDNEESLKEI